MHSALAVIRKASAIAWCGLGLAACGGGSGATGPTPAASAGSGPPLSASASVAGLIGWASHLAPDNGAEPLRTGSFKPPVDDTAEPMPII